MSALDPRVAATPDAPGSFIALAPMDGVTDWVHRDLITAQHNGDCGISLCVSEFVRVTRSAVVPKVIERHCPEVNTGGKTLAGVPVFVQILGGQPEPMAKTAALAVRMGAPGIDINFGCPAKTVNRSDGGATILQYPKRLEAITAAVRAAVPQPIPVTVKIRLGWDSAAHVEAIAEAIERGGASWLTIHARTRMQGYRPPVDWGGIGRARRAVSMPVVANGDLNTPTDVLACREISGCTAFMIGRGAMARPHLFRQLRGHDDLDLDEPRMRGQLLDYAARMLSAGAHSRAALGRCKQWLRMAAPACPRYDELFQALKQSRRLCDLIDGLRDGGIDRAQPRLDSRRSPAVVRHDHPRTPAPS